MPRVSAQGMNHAAFATAAILSLSGSGCATVVPPFDIPYLATRTGEIVPTVDSIVAKIQCELRDVAAPEGSQLNQLLVAEQDIQAVVELSLSVTQDGKLAPSFSLIGTPLNFATGFSHERSREQNFTTYLVFSLTEIGRMPPCQGNAPPDTNLAGELGIRQMFQLATSSGSYQNWKQSGNTGAFGGSITFTVDSQLSPTGPTYKLASFEGPGSLFSASNKSVNKLTFGFIRGPKAGSARAKADALGVIANVKQNQIANSLQIIANR